LGVFNWLAWHKKVRTVLLFALLITDLSNAGSKADIKMRMCSSLLRRTFVYVAVFVFVLKSEAEPFPRFVFLLGGSCADLSFAFVFFAAPRSTVRQCDFGASQSINGMGRQDCSANKLGETLTCVCAFLRCNKNIIRRATTNTTTNTDNQRAESSLSTSLLIPATIARTKVSFQ
jgi:hypothetical protein